VVKKLSIILSLAIYVLPSVAFAISLTPNTGNVTTGNTSVIEITADPPVGVIDGISMHLTVVGGTVTGFTKYTDSNLLAMENCSGGGTYTDSSVCVDFSLTTGYFIQDQVLGTFTVLWGDPGTGSVTKASDNLYLDSANIQEYVDQGLEAEFTILSATTPTPTITRSPTPTPTGRLPESGIMDGGNSILIGLLVVIGGAFLFYYGDSKYQSKNGWS